MSHWILQAGERRVSVREFETEDRPRRERRRRRTRWRPHRAESRSCGPGLRAAVVALLAAVVVAACGGSAIPYTAGGIEDAPAPAPDAVVEVGAADVPEDASDGQDGCGCTPDEPCTATDPACRTVECTEDVDCDDADACTADRCLVAEGNCLHDGVPDCCAADTDCDDGVACTRDRCVGKVCQHEPQGEGCCSSAAGCDDGLRETDDRCVRNLCVHSLDDPPVACVEAADCPSENPCVGANCVSGLCSYGTVAGDRCCAAASECDDADVCTEDYCVRFRCVYTLASQPQPRVAWDFDGEGPPEGLDLGQEGGGAAWHVSTVAAWTAPASLRAGTPGEEGYGGAGPFAIVAESVPVAFPAGGSVTLRFRTLLDVEPDPLRDRAAVTVTQQGADPVEVWSNDATGGSTGGTWVLQTVGLDDYAGQVASVRFVFTSDGAPSVVRTGWFLDDVQLVYACQTPQDDR